MYAIFCNSPFPRCKAICQPQFFLSYYFCPFILKRHLSLVSGTLTLFQLGVVKSSRTTINPSAVSEGLGLGSPKLLTLFLSIPERSQRSHFWNLFLKMSENWTSKIFRGPSSLRWKMKKSKKFYFFVRNITFSGWIFIVHALSFLLRYISVL